MSYKFRIKRGDFELELEGDREWLEAQIARFVDARPTEPTTEVIINAPAPEFHRVAADFAPKVNITIAQFVAMKEARNPPDIFIVGVYYIEKYLRREIFTLPLLQDLLAQLPAWDCQRAEDVAEEVVARGHVEKLRDGTWSITYKGQNYVREGLS